jgi:hypothetical protein
MAKLTPKLIEDALARVPEGFVRYTAFSKHFKVRHRYSLEALSQARVGQVILNEETQDRENYIVLYDPARRTPDEILAMLTWCHPDFPPFKGKSFAHEPILRELTTRERQLDAVTLNVVNSLPNSYVLRDSLDSYDQNRLGELVQRRVLREMEGVIFDPLRLSEGTIKQILQRRPLNGVIERAQEYLREKPEQLAQYQALAQKFGAVTTRRLVSEGQLVKFTVPWRHESKMEWVTLQDADIKKVTRIATEEGRIKEEEWLPAREATGDVLRPGSQDGKTLHQQVIARSYSVTNAAKRLGAKERTIEAAIRAEKLPTFIDPENHVRIPAEKIEAAAADPELAAEITGSEQLQAREIALVASMSYSSVRYRLGKEKLSRTNPTWDQVRGRWGLPNTLAEFREILKIKKAEWRDERHDAYLEEQRLEQEQLESDRQRRKVLRAQLIAAFPSWKHEGRIDQHMVMHMGPPNSGKTFHALEALSTAGSGWYLAPLRLLAFEVFDRLNSAGVLCNLLTGEEHIPVPGARITASTIEMFDASRSGQCVVIDEGQMLADPSRGWAWTRALMEAQSPEIHIVGPQTARGLIERLAAEAIIPFEVIEYERLAPIQVAAKPWSLKRLPPRTILVAFSRRSVLGLKLELEEKGRSVSVVYGNLPPEVRRRQADRFANGETEICVATDAVGMGLNLPADKVCFFEIEKFDGTERRMLLPNEVQQIGGRAGRYGLSEAGEIGALDANDLDDINNLFYSTPATLTHAYVAPSVEDLALLPGSLAEKLAQWAALQSIPDSLRALLKTADLKERIVLASLLADHEVNRLGLEAAVVLVNAPATEVTHPYWRYCASAILEGDPMPLPPEPPLPIETDGDLDDVELSITCADIYLWLSNRREFRGVAPDASDVRTARAEWSAGIDAALLSKIVAGRRCRRCGRMLPLSHPFAICDSCYTQNRRSYSRYDNERY